MNDDDNTDGQNLAETTAPCQAGSVEEEEHSSKIGEVVLADDAPDLVTVSQQGVIAETAIQIDEESLESLKAENKTLKNTIQILSDRYDKKCAEFDKLMQSYIAVRRKLGMDPQPAGPSRPPCSASPYREMMNRGYWN